MRPQAADRAHDDRVVEEHVGDQDRPDRLVEPEAGERPAGAEQRGERGAHDDGRQHERHGDERAHDPPAAELVPRDARTRPAARSAAVSTVDSAACHTVNQITWRSAGSATTSRERRRGRACRRRQPATDDRQHRVHEEHRRGTRAGRTRAATAADARGRGDECSPEHGGGPLLDPLVTVAADLRGLGSVSGLGGDLGELRRTPAGAACRRGPGTRTSAAARRPGTRSDSMKSTSLRAAAACSVPCEHPRELDLLEARVEHRADRRCLRLRLRVVHRGRRARRVRDDERVRVPLLPPWVKSPSYALSHPSSTFTSLLRSFAQ